MTAGDKKGMKDTGSSNVSHVSRKPLQCIDVTIPVISHIVEVTFWNHCDAYDLFSNKTQLSSSLFNGGKMLYSKYTFRVNDFEKYQLELCSKYDTEYDFDVILE